MTKKECLDKYTSIENSFNKNIMLEKRISALESIFNEEDDGVIRKVGNKWKILKKSRRSYWDADFDTKSDAEAALRAYWANKRESLENDHRSLVERFMEL